MNDDTDDVVRVEFRTAVEVARTALADFNAHPLVPSKRGGPRRNPAFLTWREASSIALRWHALLPRERKSPDDELARLLGEWPRVRWG